MSYPHSTTVAPKTQPADSPEEYFSAVPESIKADKRLDGNAKILLADIASLCKDSGYCWATNKFLADSFSVDERTVMRWIQQLEDLGYIVVDRTGKCKRGTERKIYMKNYPALKRNSTPEVVADILVNVAMGRDKHNRAAKPVTPQLPKVSPQEYNTCHPRAAKPVTQSESESKERIKKELKDSSPGAVAPPPKGVKIPEVQKFELFGEEKIPPSAVASASLQPARVEEVRELTPRQRTAQIEAEWQALPSEEKEKYRPAALAGYARLGLKVPREEAVQQSMYVAFWTEKKAGEA